MIYYYYSMKSHSVPAPDSNTMPEGGVMHTPSGFTWPKQRKKALLKAKYRAIHLARTNPDYQIAHPSECRENPENKILPCCHPEAEKRIDKKYETIFRAAQVPTVDRPKRLNRNG